MKNNLYLRKCAYIFDNTNTNFRYGSAEKIATERAVLAEMKSYYDSAEKRNTPIPYEYENGKIYIDVNGTRHALNALQIAKIQGVGAVAESIINNRKRVTLADVEPLANDYKIDHYMDGTITLWHRKLRSLWVDIYTGEDELGYVRIHFNRGHEQIIIDARTGDIYTSGEYGMHKKASPAELYERLWLRGTASRKAVDKVLQAITKKEV